MNPDQGLAPRSEPGISKPLRFFRLRFDPEAQQVEIFGAESSYLLDLNRGERSTRVADVPITEWHDFLDCLELLIETKKMPKEAGSETGPGPIEKPGLPSKSRTSQNYSEILRSHTIPHPHSLLLRALAMTEILDRKKLLQPMRPENFVGPNAPTVIEGTLNPIES